ncbi:hypothetical protein [Lysobacter sp. CA196]|uniref:hypothetical protein n=1 Tax=Lysobacter sp. CA196 TaxID=3455606 RepID=UPI003F8D1EF1
MNRRHDAHDPLSPEERELAERLLRLGPHDGPSPALDAKILAAAHAAVAQTPRKRSKTRWPAWIGVAASLTLAIGVAWQLRPMDKALESVGEDQATAASASSADAESAAAAAAPAAAEASDYARDSSAGAADAAAAALPEPPAPAQPRMIAPPPPPPPMEAAKRSDAAADGLRADQPRREQKRASARAVAEPVDAFPESAPSVMAAPPAPPAPASAPVYAPAPAAAPEATASDAAKPQLARERRYELREAAPAGATATSAPKAEGKAAEADLRSKPAPLLGNAARSVAPAAAVQPAKTPSADARTAQPAAANDSTTLDRIEVTGSRIKLDTAEEANLAPTQWLELIRTYRDRGDTELARDSLRRFHRAHPQARVPDDLRALLK